MLSLIEKFVCIKNMLAAKIALVHLVSRNVTYELVQLFNF